MAIPEFIQAELIGPYGTSVLHKLGKIERWYHIYEHGADFEADPSEDYTPSKLCSRQIRKLINKEAQFAFGRTPELRVTCPDETPDKNRRKPNEDAMQQLLNAVLRQNFFPRRLIQGAKDCFIGGRVAIKLNLSEDDLTINFVPADGFVYDTEADDTDKLTKIVFFYTMKDDTERSQQRIWVQKYRMQNGRCILDERITDGYGGPVGKDEFEEKVNFDTGLDRIPAVVVINGGLSGDLEGESDVETLMADDSWYNKMRSANLDSLRKGMDQITYAIGASEGSIRNFRIAPGAFWDVQPDAALMDSNGDFATPEIGTISNDFGYSTAFGDTLSDLKQEMHDVIGVPDISLESMKSIITSGKAMKAVYWPLICACEEKMTAWKPALEWLADTILYAVERFSSLQEKYGAFTPAPHTVTVDNLYPLPEDEDEEKALDLQEVANHVRSAKSYLLKWGGPDSRGLTPEEADAEIAQIAKERRLFEESFSGDLNGER